MKEYLIKRPMLICAILCVGISVAGYYSRILFCILGIFYTVIFALAILRKANVKVYICLSAVLLMLLSTASTLNKIQKLENLNGKEYTLCAIAGETTFESEDYNVTVFEVTDGNSPLKNQKISGFYEPCELETGKAVTLKIKIKSMGEGTYKSQNFSQDIFLSGNVYEITESDKKDDFVLKSVARVRKYIKETFFKNLDYNEASTLCALVFGDRSCFSGEFYNNVKGAGVSHVMVVSGMHLSILVMFFLKITEKRLYNHYIKAFLTLTVVICVMALCGFTMSILRAGITYVVATFAILLKRDNSPANTLGAATVLILISSPFAILSVAFQLSLLSTFGILAVAIPINRYVKSRELIKSKFLYEIFSSAVVTLSAMLLTLPVIISVFGCVSTVGVITNLLISYAVSLALSFALVGLAVNLVLPFAASIIFFFCDLIVKYINSIINFFGSLPISVVFLPKYYCIFAILIIIIIFYLLLACKKRIDMIKLREMNEKITKEGGKRLKWR